MIIESIVIENFRCFAGNNVLTLNNDGKVTIVYGNAGYGKSTFLQFIMWMLYDEANFGLHDDQPICNTDELYKKKLGEEISVFGRIDFTHLGLKYSLTRRSIYKVGVGAPIYLKTEQNLQALENDNWVDYKGNIPNKINSFLPKPLSKYFLLDGERARELVLNSKGLKLAIQDLFGLNAYTNAIEHIGTKSKRSSVLGFYYSEMTSKMPKRTSPGSVDLGELQSKLQILDNKITSFEIKRGEVQEQIDALSAKRDDLFQLLGESSNQDYIKQLINSNNAQIKAKQKEIEQKKHDIGNLMYKNYPYLILSDLTTKSSAELRKKNREMNQKDRIVFENLKKDLMKEILSKGVCVCGRSLDTTTIKTINDVINIMPPDSYTYQFGQFVNKSKSQIARAQIQITNIDNIGTEISVCENEINACNKANNSFLEDMKKLDESKSIVEEIKGIKKMISDLEEKRKKYDGEIGKDKRTYELASSQYEELIHADEVYNEYKEKIEFFEKLRNDLEKERKENERKIRKVLNDCVREVFKNLTTQTHLDVDRIQFVNDDFTLRSTYLTGGQQAVDVYSYVLGMIMALEEFNKDSTNQETPIVIDAPFAFTDNEQSEHIFLQFPKVSKQTILLTLDVNKINHCLRENPNLYELFIIKNETNTQARFERGSINDIKF